MKIRSKHLNYAKRPYMQTDSYIYEINEVVRKKRENLLCFSTFT